MTSKANGTSPPLKKGDVLRKHGEDLDMIAHLLPPFQEMYFDFISEIEALRDSATPADKTLAKSAAEAAEGEHQARRFAAEGADIGERKIYAEFTRLAESQRRAKADSLGRLGLTGERRGVSQARKAAHKVRSNKGTSRWRD